MSSNWIYNYEIVIEYYFLYWNELLILILNLYKICFRLKWNLLNNLSSPIFCKGKFYIQTDNAGVMLQILQIVNVQNATRIQVSSTHCCWHKIRTSSPASQTCGTLRLLKVVSWKVKERKTENGKIKYQRSYIFFGNI